MPTRLEVLQAKMEAKGCTPQWVPDGRPVCAILCPSHGALGMSCALHKLWAPDACYPMIEAMAQALAQALSEEESNVR
jgi:hypothetical protein